MTPIRFGWLWTLAAGVVLFLGLMLVRGSGLSAVHTKPLPLEEFVAKAAWRFLVPRVVARMSNPVPASPDVLKAARAHWADHCAVCHDNDGSGDTTIGRRVYPRVPDMRGERTQRLSDGELFYAIEEGIPWTAMPGWATGNAEGERDSWALVHFIRHLPDITIEELEEMERLNPRPPPDLKHEQEIEDFLKGPAEPGRGRGER